MVHQHYQPDQILWFLRMYWQYSRENLIHQWHQHFNDTNFGKSQYNWLKQRYGMKPEWGMVLNQPPRPSTVPGGPHTEGYEAPTLPTDPPRHTVRGSYHGPPSEFMANLMGTYSDTASTRGPSAPSQAGGSSRLNEDGDGCQTTGYTSPYVGDLGALAGPSRPVATTRSALIGPSLTAPAGASRMSSLQGKAYAMAAASTTGGGLFEYTNSGFGVGAAQQQHPLGLNNTEPTYQISSSPGFLNQAVKTEMSPVTGLKRPHSPDGNSPQTAKRQAIKDSPTTSPFLPILSPPTPLCFYASHQNAAAAMDVPAPKQPITHRPADLFTGLDSGIAGSLTNGEAPGASPWDVSPFADPGFNLLLNSSVGPLVPAGNNASDTGFDGEGFWVSGAHEGCVLCSKHRHDISGDGVYFRSVEDVLASVVPQQEVEEEEEEEGEKAEEEVDLIDRIFNMENYVAGDESQFVGFDLEGLGDVEAKAEAEEGGYDE